MLIITSINSTDFKEVKEKIRKVENVAEWAHLDISDGTFSKHLTWCNPKDLAGFNSKIKMEAHLMVANPEKKIAEWLKSPVKRIIVHLEAAGDLDFIIKKCRESGKEIGLAVNPETFWEKLESWFNKVDLFLLLAVSPGPSGQKISEGTFEKIKKLRAACPECKIEADGGANTNNINELARAGVDFLVVGSAVFDSDNPAENIEKLKDML